MKWRVIGWLAFAGLLSAGAYSTAADTISSATAARASIEGQLNDQ